MYSYFLRIVFCTMTVIMLSTPVGAAGVSLDDLDRQAISYLELLDQGRFEEAWQIMSAHFQAINDQTQWQKQQQAVRAAYGLVISRQVYSIGERQSYRLSADGQYITVQFKSSYPNKANAVEAVVFDCSNAPECSIRDFLTN